MIASRWIPPQGAAPVHWQGVNHVSSRAYFRAIAAAALPAAFAQSASVFVGGEAGWIGSPVSSTLTREAVLQEFLAIRTNPVAADGSRYAGGEVGHDAAGGQVRHDLAMFLDPIITVLGHKGELIVSA